jgi:putative hydrolase of the HAD superfamily
VEKVIKAVFFDLDDTLYPEKQFVMSGFRAVSQYIARKYCFESETIFNILKRDFEEGVREKNFDVLLQKLGLSNECIKDLVRIYRAHFPKISLHPDARSILEILLRGGYKLGLITDGYSQTQRKKIQVLGIEKYFEVIVINDPSEQFSKLDVLPFLRALSRLKIKPESAIYVGDNPLRDFVNAKKLGMHTVRIKRKNGEYSNIIVNRSSDADYIISDLTQLLEIIRDIDDKSIKSYQR